MSVIDQLKLAKLRIVRALDAASARSTKPDDLIVAGMATMPTRAATFPDAFASIIRQVDRLYLYLDGHSECPEPAKGHPRVVPIFSQDIPHVHANGKLLGVSLERDPCIHVTVDDDLYYPPNFVACLRSALALYDDAAIVGYHGSILAQPMERYNLNRTIFHYVTELKEPRHVDVLGTGATMFSSSTLKFDVRKWPFTNMVDLGLALEAARRNAPTISVARKRFSVRVLSSKQQDSIYVGLLADDTRQTELAKELLQVRGERRMTAPLAQ